MKGIIKKKDKMLIVSEYTIDPLLYGEKKFDVRCFALIASLDPLVILYHDAYIKNSLADYDRSVKPWDLHTYATHITNGSV